jgi:hypothetical protein
MGDPSRLWFLHALLLPWCTTHGAHCAGLTPRSTAGTPAIPTHRRALPGPNPRRPDTIHFKTRASEWAKLQSQWRWAHAYVCYIGPPSFLLWRIRAPLLFNLAFAALAALDGQAGWFGGLAARLSDDVLAAWHMLSFVLALLLVGGGAHRWWRAARQCLQLRGGACAWAPAPAQAAGWAPALDPACLRALCPPPTHPGCPQAFRVNHVYLRWSSALQAFVWRRRHRVGDARAAGGAVGARPAAAGGRATRVAVL